MEDRCVNCGRRFGDWEIDGPDIVADCPCGEQAISSSVTSSTPLTHDARQLLDVTSGGYVLHSVGADGSILVHDFATQNSAMGATLMLAMSALHVKNHPPEEIK